MAELFRVEFWNPEGEVEPELVALQSEPRTVTEVLQVCRSYRVHARLSDDTGKPRGKIDPDGGFSPT